MPFRVECAHCHQRMLAADNLIEKKVRCRACGEVFRVRPSANAETTSDAQTITEQPSVRFPDVLPPAALPIADTELPEQPPVIVVTEPVSGRDDTSPAWDRRMSLSNFFRTSYQVMCQPSATFTNMKPDGGFLRPLTYSTLSGFLKLTIVATTAYLLFLLMIRLGGEEVASAVAELHLIVVMVHVGYVIVGTAMKPVYCFAYGGMYHLMLMLIGGPRRSYEATTRAYAYVDAAWWPLALLFFVPPVSLLAGIWIFAVFVIAMAKVHGISNRKSAAAALLPLGFVLVLLSLLSKTMGVLRTIYGA